MAAAALMSAVCFLTVAVPSATGAQNVSLDIYQSRGIGQGVVATFAARPSIFDPLFQGGFLHTEAKFSAAGGGAADAFSSLLYPGSFVVGAIGTKTGCAGLPGGDYVFGTYPPVPTCPKEQQATALDSNVFIPDALVLEQTRAPLKVLRDSARIQAGHVRAAADLGRAASHAFMAGYTIGNGTGEAIISARDIAISNAGKVENGRVVHDVTVTVRGVSLLGGLLTIDTIVSRAQTRTDGSTGAADAQLTFAGVRAVIDGKPRDATITSDGVAITDSELSRQAQIGRTEEIREALLNAGLKIVAAAPTKIVDGPDAEATSGGLLIAFSATVPSAPVPREAAKVLAPVIKSFPTQCVYELEPEPVREQASVPLCFGSGVLPGNGNEMFFSLSIGNATVYSTGSIIPPAVAPGGGEFGGGGSPPIYPNSGSGTGFSRGGAAGNNNLGGSEVTVPGGPVTNSGGPLVGYVANMPSVLLIVMGALFLVLAVGAALGPSLRHAGTR